MCDLSLIEIMMFLLIKAKSILIKIQYFQFVSNRTIDLEYLVIALAADIVKEKSFNFWCKGNELVTHRDIKYIDVSIKVKKEFIHWLLNRLNTFIGDLKTTEKRQYIENRYFPWLCN